MLKILLPAAALCFAASLPLAADQWSKSYPVGASPELRVQTSDASVVLRAGTSKTIEARVFTTGWKIGPGEVHVIEHQTGDRVEIEVKFPHRMDFFNFKERSAKLEVDLPAASKVDVHTSDGSVRSDGLRGPVKLATEDGSIEGSGFDGALDATSGDGHIRVRGKFTALNLHTGDGSIEVEIAPGSHMSSGWTVHTGDGSVKMRFPAGFGANLDAHTGDGHITVDVPLAEGNVKQDSATGKINGGGPVLTVRTGDGSVHLERL